MRTDTDVLIVGAGPVGLLLACELQRRGVDYVIVDSRAQPSWFCKAVGVTPRTLQIFESLGILDEALDASVVFRGLTVFTNGIEEATPAVSTEGLPYGFVGLPQYDTERILEGLLRRHGGHVERGVKLDGFTQSSSGVEGTVVTADGESSVMKCRYLAGCDGAGSVVRKGLGLEFKGEHYAMTFMLGDVDVAWDRPHDFGYRCALTVDGEVRGGAAVIPIHGSPKRFRLSLNAPYELWADDADLSTPPSLGMLAENVAPMLPPGTGISNLRWSSFYRIGHRIVDRYSDGRVFLAGDAAHIHPPIGGQGMNTGLQDAHNLAWKLALAVQGKAAPGLLDSYSAERHPVGVDVVAETTKAMDAAMTQREWNPQQRESQLYTSYAGTPWVGEHGAAGSAEAPVPGQQAPDAAGLGRNGVGHAVRFHDAIRGLGHAVVFYADDHSAVGEIEALWGKVSAMFGGSVTCRLVVDPAWPGTPSELPTFTDDGGNFATAYRCSSRALYVIRPDGHMGFRADSFDAASLLAHLGKTLAPIG